MPQVSVETCLPPRGSHAWLQRHAAALYFEAPVSSEADYSSPLPQATFGVIHRRIRNEDAAGTCAANFRWLRRLNGAPKPHGYWVAGPQPPSAAPADDILEWAMDMHDSCRLGHDSLMALLSQRVRSMQEMSRQYDCTDPEMAQIVFPIAKLVPIRRMLPACRSLRVSGMRMQPMHPAGGQHASACTAWASRRVDPRWTRSSAAGMCSKHTRTCSKQTHTCCALPRHVPCRAALCHQTAGQHAPLC